MPKRFWSASGMPPGSRTRPYKTWRTGARTAGRRRAPSRFAGYYRKSGYYGRYGAGSAKPELKFHDIDVDDAVIAAGATIQNAGTINIIAQDTTESTRVGRKCTIRNINWRYKMRLPATSTQVDTGDTVRMILYLDKQCNGTTAVTTDILETADFQSFNNLANKSRFRILLDRTYPMFAMAGSGRGTTDTLAFGETIKVGTFFKKCSIPIEYDNTATTGALTTIRSNNLGVMLLSESGLASFSSKFRLRFSDS